MSGDVGFAGVPGVPEGWELVWIGTPGEGESYMDDVGHIILNEILGQHTCVAWPIVRKAEPVCVWPRGVFKNGWIAEDRGEGLWWYDQLPEFDPLNETWYRRKVEGAQQWEVKLAWLANPPVFRADLPFSKRIQQVGPGGA